MAEKTSAHLRWIDGMKFLGRSESGHGVVMDSPKDPEHAGASPMEHLLLAVAGCTAMDVVAILGKMRQNVTGLEVAVEGERAEANPKRFTSIEMVYRVRGRGLSRDKVERAVELSQSTYCSASATLRPDCAVTSRIELVEEPD